VRQPARSNGFYGASAAGNDDLLKQTQLVLQPLLVDPTRSKRPALPSSTLIHAFSYWLALPSRPANGQMTARVTQLDQVLEQRPTPIVSCAMRQGS